MCGGCVRTVGVNTHSQLFPTQQMDPAWNKHIWIIHHSCAAFTVYVCTDGSCALWQIAHVQENLSTGLRRRVRISVFYRLVTTSSHMELLLNSPGKYAGENIDAADCAGRAKSIQIALKGDDGLLFINRRRSMNEFQQVLSCVFTAAGVGPHPSKKCFKKTLFRLELNMADCYLLWNMTVNLFPLWFGMIGL